MNTSLSVWTAFADVLFIFGGRLVSWTLTKMSIIIYFLFILFVSYVRISTYVRELVTPTGQGFPPPFFLGVATGLEFRIRL